MKHLEEALEAMGETPYIKVEGNKVIFWIQYGPIKEKAEAGKMIGVNGVQATDMLKYCQELFISLNEAFPCNENAMTIAAIELAVGAQKMRALDREKRGVEGKSEA